MSEARLEILLRTLDVTRPVLERHTLIDAQIQLLLIIASSCNGRAEWLRLVDAVPVHTGP